MFANRRPDSSFVTIYGLALISRHIHDHSGHFETLVTSRRPLPVVPRPTPEVQSFIDQMPCLLRPTNSTSLSSSVAPLLESASISSKPPSKREGFIILLAVSHAMNLPVTKRHPCSVPPTELVSPLLSIPLQEAAVGPMGLHAHSNMGVNTNYQTARQKYHIRKKCYIGRYVTSGMSIKFGGNVSLESFQHSGRGRIWRKCYI